MAKRHVVRAALVLASLTLAATAAGQQGSEKVAAQALFDEGRRLLAQGKIEEACPKFADSERLDPTPGTQLNLASCYEKLGRLASAWAAYKEAISLATAASRNDYVQTAQRHADALFPRLSRVVVTLAAPAAGLEVRRDGVVIGAGELGVPIPIDPGDHTFEASAPQKKSWKSTLQVPTSAAALTVSVPALEELPVASAPAPPTSVTPAAPSATTTSAPADEGSGRRAAGVVVGGVGVAALVAGGVFGLVAKSKYNDSLSHCPNDNNACDANGVSTRNAARSDGNVATVFVSVGGAALITGAVLWFTAPSSGAARVGLVPTLGGANLRGEW